MDAKYAINASSIKKPSLLLKGLGQRLNVQNLASIFKKDIYKRREALNTVLNKIANGEEHTIVVASSITFAPEDVKDIKGIVHYESRGLWEVLKASSLKTKVVFISSLPISEATLNHLLLQAPNGEEMRGRITLLSLGDASPNKSLTSKILANAEFIERIKEFIAPEQTYLQTFISSEEENLLADQLGIPLFGADPKLGYFQTKSGNRQIFSEANVAFADGHSDIKSYETFRENFLDLWSKYPNDKRFMLKLDTGVSGNGNAIIKLPMSYEDFCQIEPEQRQEKLEEIFATAKFQAKGISWNDFKDRLKEGAVLETFIEGKEKSSPSAQALLHPNGKVELLSTHEQILDDSGMTFLGSVFPANASYRKTLHEYTLNIGKALTKQGLIGTIAVDFLLVHDHGQTKVWVIEINVRRGGTTHPYQTAKLLTSATYNEDSGLLMDQANREIHYVSDDNVVHPKLVGTEINQFISFMNTKNIIFDANKQSGVIFHLLEAMKDHGKVGFTAIGTSKEEARIICEKTQALINEFIKA